VFGIETLLIVALITLVTGTIIGVAVGRAWIPPAQQKELEKRLSTATDELTHYQQDVAKHFLETSQRVAELTQCYRELHEHLAKGAMKLTNTEIGRQLLDAGGATDVIADVEEISIEPPRDWAPKVPGAQGMLSEEFGLKDNDEINEHTPTIRSRT
jgi:uncharacterized protein